MSKFLITAFCCTLLWGCGGRNATVQAPALNEPDRVLYEQAMQQLDRGRWDVARLLFQNLIAAHLDSEYVPLAKYGQAESYYLEGTRAALVQADYFFREYIAYFPQTELAADAQLMVAMSNIRQMNKPDRDQSKAYLAELELQRMISQYPNSAHLDEAKEKLRDVQDVLAAHHHGVANHYLRTGIYWAAVDRYAEVLEKYPDYARMDEVLYAAGEALRRSGNGAEGGVYYAQLVRDYPLSKLTDDATRRLVELSLPVPDPNPIVLARAQPPERGVVSRFLGMFRGRPDVSTETGAASVRDDERFSIESDGIVPASSPE